MTTSKYFNHISNKEEQTFYEDIIVESIQIGGQDVYYIPREKEKVDIIMGESIENTFGVPYVIEVFFENLDSFAGSGEMMSKFGLSVEHDLNFKMSRKRFEEEVGTIRERPLIGDLIYVGDINAPRESFINGIFEIVYVTMLEPFYQLGTSSVYTVNCQRFAYSHEKFETGIPVIDNLFEAIGDDVVPTDNSEFEDVQNEIQDFSETNIFGNM
jgi:hypothetical protein